MTDAADFRTYGQLRHDGSHWGVEKLEPETRVLIERMGYQIAANRIKDSKCPDCGAQIAGFGL